MWISPGYYTRENYSADKNLQLLLGKKHPSFGYRPHPSPANAVTNSAQIIADRQNKGKH